MIIKPILFNTEMVRAILDGRKTVTRRLVKFKLGQNPQWSGYIPDGMVLYGSHNIPTVKSPYKPEDILYVRETWRVRNVYGDFKYGNRTAEIEFKAGGEYVYMRVLEDVINERRWRPSIHMPKEAARLFLRVKNVRVERLLTPFLADGAAVLALKKEGVVLPTECVECISNYGTPTCVDACDDSECGILDDVRGNFSDIWNSTVKPADLALYGWNANPWVWVIEFERCDKPVEVNSNG